MHTLMHEADEVGAAIVAVETGWLDTSSPVGRLVTSLFADLTMWERSVPRERTRAALG